MTGIAPVRDRFQRAACIVMLVGVCPALPSCAPDDTTGPPSDASTTEPAKDYFQGDKYLNETVTVTATVTKVFTPTSFELAAGQYGDNSLLVLSARSNTISKGDVVQVTGRVQEFSYDSYHDQYDLGDARMYNPYPKENVLIAQSVRVQTPHRTGK
ncbi:hypothetical protein [Nonomuraea sp. SYSU D8015]|uniref:hypothetical protein n=1 Tax=Nonomuraea sp. SYSU D8015 TaxID=2593644 RepID=UPI0016611D17|nr:hypothetical protein [Nonomuraea sp. SYSU D8015]